MNATLSPKERTQYKVFKVIAKSNIVIFLLAVALSVYLSITFTHAMPVFITALAVISLKYYYLLDKFCLLPR